MNAGVTTNLVVLRGAIKDYQVERKVGNFIWLDIERGRWERPQSLQQQAAHPVSQWEPR